MGHQPPKSPAPSFLRPLIALDTTISHSLHTLTRSFTPRSILLLLEFLADFRFTFPSFLYCFLFYFSRLPILESMPDLKSRAHPAITSLIRRWIGEDDIVAVNLLLFLFWTWALATAFSRITLGRHYVLDIFVGACLGVLEALFTLRFLSVQLLS
ncbi:hypothetical protein K1719_041366 [Acacia pycnantha]|nr:hypothetical protein K1719_041366 [Acacia pycnantha]